MYLVTYLEFLRETEGALAGWYRALSAGHAPDADVHFSAARFAAQCGAHAAALGEQIERLGPPGASPAGMPVHLPERARSGPAGLLRDLLDAHQAAGLLDITWALVRQAAQGARDARLLAVADACAAEITAQLAWLTMTLTSATPQVLLVAD